MIQVPAGSTVATVNTALTQAANAGGGTVMLAAGDYPVQANEQIVWPANSIGVSLIGEGMYGSRVQVAAGRSTDVMVMTAGNPAHVSVRDVGFVIDGAISGGAVIHAANHHNLILERILLLGPFYDGIKIDGGSGQYLATLDKVSIEGAASSFRSLALGSDNSPVTQGIYIYNCKFAQSQYGIWCDFVSGLDLVHTELLNHTQHGFLTYPVGPNRSCEAFQITGLTADSCGGAGIYFGGGGGFVDRISMINCWSGSNNVGLEILGAPNGNRFLLGFSMLTDNKTEAIRDYGATSFQQSNNIIG